MLSSQVVCACVCSHACVKDKQTDREMSCDTANHPLQSLISSCCSIQAIILASLHYIPQISFKIIKNPTNRERVTLSSWESLRVTKINKPSSLYTKDPQIVCLLLVYLFPLLPSYHFWMSFSRSFQERPIISYCFASRWVRSGLTTSSNTPGPLLLIQCFTSTV